MFKSSWSKVLAGFVLGTVGVPLLRTKTADKVFTYATAGAFIAKDAILEEAEKIQAKAMDVSDDAKVLVEKYYQDKDAEHAANIAGQDDAAETVEAEVTEA